ncbi:MAG: hypothetical protein AAFX93_16485 [Verrucomicrobiota bacterium]
MKISLFVIPLLALNATLSSFADQAPRLELVWETEPIFSYPESVVYDPARSVLYVSNIGETPKDNSANGDGFVSILSLSGTPIVKNYIRGLNDPKGMDLDGDTLWVNDRDAIVEWDLAEDQLEKRHELENIVFLNDISVGPEGEIFSNDADGHKVLKLEGDQWNVFWSDPDEGRPNGIRVEKDRIMLAMNWSHQLIAIDKGTMEISLLLDGIGAGDGIEPVGNGGYLITDYLGRIIYLSPEGVGSVLIDSREDKLTADLEYIQDQNLVLIPRHKNNSVAAYRLIWD